MIFSRGWLPGLTACLLSCSPLLTSASSSHKQQCKAIPGTPDWPSPASWKRLNESLAGRLLQPPPPGAVCHPGQPTYDAGECPNLLADWSKLDYHHTNPVSTYWNNWSNDTCLPYPGYPCSGQGYPLFVINATTARHVQLGVRFAKKHNIRLVVKNTGHDFIGRSSAPNSLSIWVHSLKDWKYHGEGFRPKRCKTTLPGTYLTAGSGSQMWDIYTRLDKMNQTIVGGGGKTVALGGYLTGGGHSLLSPYYGMAADHVVEIEAVTPLGEVITANSCQNQDIFWAILGGGGSTFAIPTLFTLKTHPTPSLSHLNILIITPLPNTSSIIFPLQAYITSQFPSLSTSGLSGYAFLLPPSTPFPLFPNITNGIGGFFMSCVVLQSSPSSFPQDILSLWDPVLSHINTTFPLSANNFTTLTIPTSYPSFLAYFAAHHDTTPAGTNILPGGRLLDAPALTRNLTALSETYSSLSRGPQPASSIIAAHLVSGPGVHTHPNRFKTSLLPSWRTSYLHVAIIGGIALTGVVFGESFPPLNETAKSEAYARVLGKDEIIKQLAPDTGAYMNEASPIEEKGWQQRLWGENYDRLKRIKRTVDPTDVFWCTPCVGNERWKQVGDRLCRV
ncbi:hypothetical protein QC764_113010 [Podospora pseudoanserina]|uniref:FAD-binding PCMH-type domain-containing protein n=1 Tax=Podospora pseudoanserina TaxID=2609844 RepID=A0ABR0IP57_9PEZI|nr:hypothetical protein QC764_113010 [Podospora pseudoanserina]